MINNTQAIPPTDMKNEKRAIRRAYLLDGPLIRVIPAVALPQIVSMLIDSLYNMADTYFVSRLGEAATAAVGVNDSLMMLIRALALGFAIGMSTYTSRLIGAKRYDTASRAVSTTLCTSAVVIGTLALIAAFFISPLITLLGTTANARQHAMEYARWILLSAPVTAATVCLSHALRSEGSTVFSMIGSLSGCVVNVILDPVFIHIFGLGVAGAAIATDISKVISLVILFSPYLRGSTLLCVSARLFVRDKELFREIARMGIPTAMRTCLMSVSSIVVNNVSSSFGDVALASVSVANKLMKLVSSGILGLGHGFQPVAGVSWGAGRYRRTKEAFWLTTWLGTGAVVLLGSLLYLFAVPALCLFTSNPAMIEVGVLFVRSQCVVLPLHMWGVLCNGMFQSIGKPVRAATIGLARQGFCLIPCVIILPRLFGLTGLALSQAAADVMSFTVALALMVPMLRDIRNDYRND